MIERKKFTHTVGSKELTIETSILAEQANAAVLARYGQTVVLATAVMGHKDVSMDYMPLRVEYEEKFYAAGKVLGSRFVRREGRPSEDAILTGRLIDRVIRPLFDHRLRRELQVVTTVLSYDEEHDPDFVGLVAASTALAISDIPWNGPAAGVRLVKINGKYEINPSNSVVAGAQVAFDSFVAGVPGLINMIELAGNEAQEDDIVDGFLVAQKEIDGLAAFQKSIVEKIGKPKAQVSIAAVQPELADAVRAFIAPRLDEAMYQKDKKEQVRRMHELRVALNEHILASFGEEGVVKADHVFEDELDKLVHKNILESDRRPDSRKLDELRALNGEVGLFERTHGSGLFIRGNTQALAIVTLAAPGQEQLIESMEQTTKRRFLLHYNFPAFSTGEVGSFRGPGRREIGHGALAEKALRPLIPSKDAFPYTIRVVSEILSSNGSSSMATVCASSLALMDAGVPLVKPAAGIAMGLMSDGKGTYKVLTDIQGPEDHYGDMDFKGAGTKDGVTAIQMDVKVDGVPAEVFRKAFAQAKKARLEILSFLVSVLKEPRPALSKYAPSIKTLRIDPEKIGLVIGPGGKTINGMIEKFGLASIDIDEDGGVFVSGTDVAAVDRAIAEITALTKEFKVGDIVEGNVVKVMEFGAIVDLGGGQDGMVHVSEFKNEFVKNINDVVKMGDFLRAKVIRAEDGKIGLSVKQLKD